MISYRESCKTYRHYRHSYVEITQLTSSYSQEVAHDTDEVFFIMKRKLFILFVLLTSTMGVKAQEAYAVFSDDYSTLTFYFDDDCWNRIDYYWHEEERGGVTFLSLDIPEELVK